MDQKGHGGTEKVTFGQGRLGERLGERLSLNQE
jgi:hypothetical protein